MFRRATLILVSFQVSAPFLLAHRDVLAQDAAAFRKKAAVNFRTPPREFQEVTVGGRAFIVEKQLLVEAPSVADRVLKRLNENIEVALRIVPPHSHAQITKQRFYLMYGPEARGGGGGCRAAAHIIDLDRRSSMRSAMKTGTA